jgi:hypothetical protein
VKCGNDVIVDYCVFGYTKLILLFCLLTHQTSFETRYDQHLDFLNGWEFSVYVSKKGLCLVVLQGRITQTQIQKLENDFN